MRKYVLIERDGQVIKSRLTAETPERLAFMEERFRYYGYEIVEEPED